MEEYKGKVIAVSGGFDPVHVGHVRMFKAAKEIVGEEGKLIVILNGDSWLQRKKGDNFMNQNDRAEIIEAFNSVDEAFVWESNDANVGEALREVRPDIFANGGDRDEINATDPNSSLYKDIAICKELGIVILYNIGGDKIRSSSDLLDTYKGNI